MLSFAIPAAIVPKAILGVSILVGVLMCFFGYRLFKLALVVAGFVLGAVVATYVAWRLTTQPELVQKTLTYPDIISALAQAYNRIVLMVWALAGGIAGAVVSVLMHKVGVFILGVCLGGMLANATMAQAPAETYLIVLAVLGLVGGIVALILRRAVVVLSTALNGAIAIVFGGYALVKNYSPREAIDALRLFNTDLLVLIGCAFVLAIVGGYVQFSSAPRPKEGGAPKKNAEKGKDKKDKKK